METDERHQRRDTDESHWLFYITNKEELGVKNKLKTLGSLEQECKYIQVMFDAFQASEFLGCLRKETNPGS